MDDQAEKGPDNNKRLAFLEERIPLLIAAATAVVARFAPDMELAPKDENEDLLDVQIRLLNQVAEVDATPGERAAIARAEAAEKGAEDLEQKLRAKPKSTKARKLGKVANDPEVIGAAMAEGAELELVFSTGTKEIVELEPLGVKPKSFRRLDRGRVMLDEPIYIKGSVDGTIVAGVALLSGKEQIGYSSFPNPVNLPAGQEVKLDRTIIF